MIKITKDSRLYIWGTSLEVRSGGAEVLNMLAADLKKLGVNAKMFSWDMEMYEQAPYYKERYDVNCCSWEEITNTEDCVVLIPECMIENPDNLEFFRTRTKVQWIIWWLSTSFDYNDMSKKTSKRKQMEILKGMQSHCLNLCESELAMRDLLHHGVEARMIFQHGLNEVFYNYPVTHDKQNIVMYNGIKSATADFVNDYIAPRMPDVIFKPVTFSRDSFMSKETLCDEYYDISKVYIDFCGFEGRELMPREACIRNCVLFLGNAGNASTFDDYPIPSYYKVDMYGDVNSICNKIRDAIQNYDKHIKEFGFFKNKCLMEPMKWKWELYNIFGPMINK